MLYSNKHIANLYDSVSNSHIISTSDKKSSNPKFLAAVFPKVALETMLSEGRIQPLECGPELLCYITSVYLINLERGIVLSIQSKPNSE